MTARSSFKRVSIDEKKASRTRDERDKCGSGKRPPIGTKKRPMSWSVQDVDCWLRDLFSRKVLNRDDLDNYLVQREIDVSYALDGRTLFDMSLSDFSKFFGGSSQTVFETFLVQLQRDKGSDFDFVTYFRQRLKDEKSTATQAASQASCNASPNIFPSSLAASITGGVPMSFSETAWRQPQGYAQANSQFLYSAQPQQQEQQHQQLQAPIPMPVHALGSHSNEFSQDSLAHTCTGVAMLPEISGSLGWATQTSLLLPHDTQRGQWTAPQHIADGTAISTSLPSSNPLQRTSASMGTSSCTVPTLGNPHHHVTTTGNSTQAEGSPASGAAQYQASLTSTTLNLDLSISPATSVGTGKATLCPPASLPLSSRPSQQSLLLNTTHLQFPSSPSSMAQVSELGSMCNEPSRDCQDLLAIEPMTGLQLGNIWPSDVMPNHPTGGKDWDMTSFYPASQRSASHAHYSSVQASFATSPLASSVFSDSSEELASTCFSMISPNNNSVFDEPTKLPPQALGSQGASSYSTQGSISSCTAADIGARHDVLTATEFQGSLQCLDGPCQNGLSSPTLQQASVQELTTAQLADSSEQASFSSDKSSTPADWEDDPAEARQPGDAIRHSEVRHRKRRPPLPPSLKFNGADSPVLYEFLLELLNHSATYKHIITWINKSQGLFRLNDTESVAALWGIQRNKMSMNYDKMSRALRYYHNEKTNMFILEKIKTVRRVYRFLSDSHWNTYSSKAIGFDYTYAGNTTLSKNGRLSRRPIIR